MNKYELFSKRLKEVRKDMNLTQKQFAEKIGFTQATLSAYENNPKSPSLDIVIDIAEKCNASLDWLCGLSDQKNKDKEICTKGDIIEKILDISKVTDMSPEVDVNPFTEEPVGVIKLYDKNICTFIQKWVDMKRLYDDGTIEAELYDLWIKNQIETYNSIRTIRKDQINNID